MQYFYQSQYNKNFVMFLYGMGQIRTKTILNERLNMHVGTFARRVNFARRVTFARKSEKLTK